MDGYPGKNYWQNKGRYDIAVTVTPDTKIVSGAAKIVYSNNSPDTLYFLAIRFVNNINKSAVVCDTLVLNGLSIQSFSVNNEPYEVDSKNWGTVAGIRLRRPILPKSSVELNI